MLAAMREVNLCLLTSIFQSVISTSPECCYRDRLPLARYVLPEVRGQELLEILPHELYRRSTGPHSLPPALLYLSTLFHAHTQTKEVPSSRIPPSYRELLPYKTNPLHTSQEGCQGRESHTYQEIGRENV